MYDNIPVISLRRNKKKNPKNSTTNKCSSFVEFLIKRYEFPCKTNRHHQLRHKLKKNALERKSQHVSCYLKYFRYPCVWEIVLYFRILVGSICETTDTPVFVCPQVQKASASAPHSLAFVDPRDPKMFPVRGSEAG